MELTTSYQKLNEAYLGTDNYGGKLYIRIYAKYSEQDATNNRTKVQYQARYYFDKNWSLYDRQSRGNVSGTGAETVSFSKSDNYSGGEDTLATTEAWVTHNVDGTKSIEASAYLNLPNFGWSATATGTATLPVLHKAPTSSIAMITENNVTLTNISVPATTIVQYLSVKSITAIIMTYDSATLTNTKLYSNGNEIATGTVTSSSSSGNRTTYQVSFYATFGTAGELEETTGGKALLQIKTTDSLNAVGTADYTFDMVKYTKPTFDNALTYIRRFTGYSSELQTDVVLTDSKAGINIKAYRYNGADLLGTNNSIKVKYKIWERNTSEPVSYTTLSTTSASTVTITDKILNNIDYLKVYKYKIRVEDGYSGGDEKESEVPTGVPVWSEYKDHVDFVNITMGGNPIVESDSNADGAFVKYADGTMICYKTITDEVAMTSSWGSLYEGSMDLGDWPEEFISVPHVQITNAGASGAILESYDTQPTATTAGTVYLVRATSLTVNVTLNVMAIGKWK